MARLSASRELVLLSFAYQIGIERDQAAAAQWFERAAKQGNDLAQIALAEASRDGARDPRSATLAYVWAAQVPFTPEREAWHNEVAKGVPRPNRAKAHRLAEGLRPLMYQVQSARPNPPAPGVIAAIDGILSTAAEGIATRKHGGHGER